MCRWLWISVLFLLSFLSLPGFVPQKSPVVNNTLSNKSPDFINKYRKVESYIPNESTPVKTIVLNFNVFSLPDTKENREAFRLVMEWVNGWYANNAKPSDPLPGVKELSDTRIRFEVADRIYFYPAAGLAKSCDVSAMKTHVLKADPARMKQLNIYFSAGPCTQHAESPYPSFDYYTSCSSLNSEQYAYVPIRGTPIYATAQALAHELGHTLDLMHTYEASCCHETCDPNSFEYLDDVFGKGKGGPCWHQADWACDPAAKGNTCTNNMMGGAALTSYYFSPKQIGKMHRALAIKTTRRFVKGYPASDAPLVVNQNETWDFDIRLYSGIKVTKGATLTIKGIVSIPASCNITTEEGGRLIVEGRVNKGS